MSAWIRYGLVFAVIILTLLLVALTGRESNLTMALTPQKIVKKAEAPILDYETEVATEKGRERKEKDERFNGRGAPDRRKPIGELPAKMEPLPQVSHWWIGLSALPVAKSKLVIIGRVTDRHAHLSGDRTGIYSEFTVSVEEVLKDATSSVVPGGQIAVNRIGGNVRFASGKVQKYSISRQGMPGEGGQYVLFLERTADGDLMILTGYELAGGKVTPLDGEDTEDPRSALPFARYRGADQVSFLQELRAAVQSLKTGGNQ